MPGAARRAVSKVPIAILVIVMAMAASVSTAVTGARPAAASKPSTALIKTTRVAFENCPARSTVMKVTMLGLTFSTNEPILVGISIRNDSDKACGHLSLPRSAPLASLGIQIGPCGNVSMVVEDAQRHEVFPGPGDAPSCAQRFSVRVPAHHSVASVGVWSQQLGLHGQTPVPRGIYRIIIDKVITFTVTLTSPGGSLAPGQRPTTPPRPGPCGRVFNLIASTPTTTPGPKCPIGQIAPPLPGSTPTPTVPPTTTTTAPMAHPAAHTP
jgi:hypothetical protein